MPPPEAPPPDGPPPCCPPPEAPPPPETPPDAPLPPEEPPEAPPVAPPEVCGVGAVYVMLVGSNGGPPSFIGVGKNLFIKSTILLFKPRSLPPGVTTP